ncbi:YggT family protein [Phormidium sp. LEGE 05292]|uniref:YggT family protein n=1 Tax=[Phormidium] sp. LEGE 05292 TaxID=767427 RepID=UPI0018808BCC|nr:YggT family protein [Phormidium sp. LEGE 05292]MBE9227279.1 YggT family protein [Phormidium sp. LEGE 05292]
MSPVALLLTTLATFLNIYMVLLIIRFLLSWFPNLNWYDPPLSILGQLTDPYINFFRSFIPPIGGIDFISPTIAILVLQLAAGFLTGLRSQFLY